MYTEGQKTACSLASSFGNRTRASVPIDASVETQQPRWLPKFKNCFFFNTNNFVAVLKCNFMHKLIISYKIDTFVSNLTSSPTKCFFADEFDGRMDLCQIENSSWSPTKILFFRRTCSQILKREDQGRGSKSSCDSQKEQRVEDVSRPRSLGEVAKAQGERKGPDKSSTWVRRTDKVVCHSNLHLDIFRQKEIVQIPLQCFLKPLRIL